MPTTSQLAAFVIASILFIQLPGPSLLFTIGRALTVGRRDALLSVVGNGLGVTVQALLVAIGLGAVIAASTTAFTVIKLAGAAYVIYLGVQAIRQRDRARRSLNDPALAGPEHPWRAIRVGFVVGVSNPKTIVFFGAFLPQFVSPGAPAAPQLVLLGMLFGVMAICSDGCWALAAGQARAWFAKRPERLDRLGATGGAMMVGLGATMAVSGSSH